MQLVSLRLPIKLLSGLDKKAKKLRCNRSQLIRKMLEDALLDGPDERQEQLDKLRTELLMAVGQVGASVKEIPRFIRSVAAEDAERLSRSKKTPSVATVIDVKGVSEDSAKTMQASAIEQNQSNKIDAEKWSYVPGAEAAPLRPRAPAIHDPSEPMILEAELMESSTAAQVDAVGTFGDEQLVQANEEKRDRADRRAPRHENQLHGLDIGDERRQSIRLARVLVYKGWDLKRLSERFKLPMEQIENALAGRGDLASLKVEALLATWEDEMLVSGWTVPNGNSGS